ncbi:hypothetical protein B0T20DRAFT_353668 [Sordaria brevicollis]|uniref:Metallothionein n=1 Tax=Sordaria brevicollis TaxID=83679 RepID=A0AAE0PER3_SORBR|nr:hypothetical protein B0T20DRAFT_353668 [Sordaria brevicollis]
MSDMDPHKANTKADKASGAASGTNKGPTTGSASSESEIKDKPSTMATQTCNCASTGSCTCAPGQCACPNCPVSFNIFLSIIIFECSASLVCVCCVCFGFLTLRSASRVPLVI